MMVVHALHVMVCVMAWSRVQAPPPVPTSMRSHGAVAGCAVAQRGVRRGSVIVAVCCCGSARLTARLQVKQPSQFARPLRRRLPGFRHGGASRTWWSTSPAACSTRPSRSATRHWATSTASSPPTLTTPSRSSSRGSRAPSRPAGAASPVVAPSGPHWSIRRPRSIAHWPYVSAQTADVMLTDTASAMYRFLTT